ncbi:MAG: hypothetical protein HY922_03670 [Elusimicrobia bacterium]|nr:hypothetical protein [Elusimicrobiota bacterium]
MRSKRPIFGLREIKSIHSAGIRSIPKTQRSGYLELYTLGREKDRLEKESFALDKRRAAAARQLSAVIGRIIKLQKGTGLTERPAAPKGVRSIQTRPMKTLGINY